MTFNYSLLCTLVLFCLLFSNCETEIKRETETKTTSSNSANKKETSKQKITVPKFNADSAFFFIKKQVDFGPRIPNTKEHISCADWLEKKLTNYGFNVLLQKGKVTAFNGAKLNIVNIIGRYNLSSPERIMLCAHWDTRPFADRDSMRMNLPIDGANDGASGVGVLIEIARIIQLSNPTIGIDIIFFDAEDYGAPSMSGQFFDLNAMNDTWCLGSQYFCKNPIIENYRPKFGILLDMVGAKNATFPKEGISRQFAHHQLNKVWKKAQKLGYGNYFVNRLAPPITDDHTYINQLCRIPTIDIIHYAPRTTNGRFDFGKFHHTHMDNIDNIHKPTLEAVGQTVLHVIYENT